MKKLLAVAVLATTTAAFAADNRNIFDVQYLPNAGTTYGETDWSMEKGEIKAGQDSETSGWTLSQVVGHSFTDRLSAQLGVNYTDVETDPDGGSKSTVSGISDPTATVRFRTMDEAWRWDVIGGALISLGDEKVENSDGDTNNYEGGHDLFLGTQIGQRWDKMQWAVLGQYTHHMEATRDNDAGGDTDTDAYGDWTLRADLLNQLAEKSFLRSHITGVWTPEVDSETANVDATAVASEFWELGVQYQHLFSQDLLARAGVDYQMTNMSGQDSNKAWVYTIGARYQF